LLVSKATLPGGHAEIFWLHRYLPDTV
jgi:hypothetical protein